MTQGIQQLSGKKLEHAFIRAAYQQVIGGEDGPLVSMVGGGAVAVFADKENPPKIIFCDYSGDEALVAFEMFQDLGAVFEVEHGNTHHVRCKISDITAMGTTYLEAGMRAYILYAEKIKTNP